MKDLNAWLVFLHVIGAAAWLGAWAAICMFAASVVRDPDTAALRRFFAVMRSLGPTVIGPSTLLVLGAGVALVARYDRVAFGDRWIIGGLALYVLVTIIGMVSLRRASDAVKAGLDADDLPAAATAARNWLRAAVIVTVLLAVATWDMVFRP